ncbi:HK97 family phage prohead protease [Clostridium gasigenes]|uniref:HK97 family phage prohead protease n=1 Tax=Clostridium gasigenes TaxID=94869 RepID=UPI0016252EA2|nr:HK97 family phage prohead protease [Clostridium gasigenes]MBB6622563.1 HK97 family phage prohead protease [Clostridium gasigenes]
MKVEIRGNNSVKISGYVNASERDSRVIKETRGQFVEQVKSGVFTRALANSNDIKMLLNHDTTNVLGSTRAGTLVLKEDNIGLFAEAEIADPIIIAKAKNKELRGWSFGFSSKKESWGVTDNPNLSRRFLEDISVSEVSIIDSKMLPFYAGTSIETRAEGQTEDSYMEIRGSEDKEIETIEAKEKDKNEERANIDLVRTANRKIELIKLKGAKY